VLYQNRASIQFFGDASLPAVHLHGWPLAAASGASDYQKLSSRIDSLQPSALVTAGAGTSGAIAGSCAGSLVGRMFQLQPDALQEMLATINNTGREWTGVLKIVVQRGHGQEGVPGFSSGGH
jgi:hypothetical protein